MRKWSALIVAGSAAAALLVGATPPARDAGPGQERAISLADVRVGF